MKTVRYRLQSSNRIIFILQFEDIEICHYHENIVRLKNKRQFQTKNKNSINLCKKMGSKPLKL